MAEIIQGVFDFDFNADKARASISALISDLKKLEGELKDTDKTSEELSDTEKKAAAVRAKLQKAIKAEASTVAGLTAQKRALLSIEKKLPGSVNLVTAAQKKLIKTEKQLTSETVKLGKATGSSGSSFLKSAGTFAAGAVAIGAVKEIAIDGAIELFGLASEMEVLGAKAKTVFGDALPLVTEQAKQNAAALGLTTGAYTDAAAAIADLLVPIGFERETGAEYSTQLLNRAAALSEWSGGALSAEEVTQRLGKALLGEREGLTQLGIKISDQIVTNRLLSKGQEKLTGDALQRAKAEATLELILEKSVDAQTAYNNNADTLIRRQSELRAKIGDLKETLATALTPAFHDLTAAAVPAASAISEAIGIVARGETDLSNYSNATKEAVSWVSSLSTAGGEVAEAYKFFFDAVLTPLYDLLSGFIVPIFNLLQNVTAALGFSASETGERFNVFKAAVQLTTVPLRALIGFVGLFQSAFFEGVIPALQAGIKGLEIFATGAVRARNAIAELSGGRIEKIPLPDFSAAIEFFNLKGKDAGEAFSDGVEEATSPERRPETAPPRTPPPAVDPAAKKAAEKAAKDAEKARERELKKAEAAARQEAEKKAAALEKLNGDLSKLREAERAAALSDKDREIEETVSRLDALKNRIIELKGAEAAEVAEIEELKNDKIRDIENRYLEERNAAAIAAAERRAAAEIEAEIAEIEAEGLSRLLKVERIKQAQISEAATLGAEERAAAVAAIEQNAAEVSGKIETETKRRILAIQLREAEAAAKASGTAEAKAKAEALRLELLKLDAPAVSINIETTGGDDLGEKLKQIAEEAIGLFGTVSDSIADIFAAQTARAAAAVDTQRAALDNIRANSEEYNAEQLEIEKKRLEEAEEAQRRAAEREKRIAAVQLLTNTLITVSKAAAQGGIAAPFTIAASLAALIAGFAKARAAAAGAFFEGSDFVDPSGQYPAGRDTVPAYLNRGEAVIQTDKNKEYYKTVKAIRRGAVPAGLLNEITEAYIGGGRERVSGLFDAPAFLPAPVAIAGGSGGAMDKETAAALIRRLENIEEAISGLPEAMPQTAVNASAEGIFLLTRKIGERRKKRRDRAK